MSKRVFENDTNKSSAQSSFHIFPEISGEGKGLKQCLVCQVYPAQGHRNYPGLEIEQVASSGSLSDRGRRRSSSDEESAKNGAHPYATFLIDDVTLNIANKYSGTTLEMHK